MHLKMGKHAIHRYLTPELRKVLQKWLKIVQCSFVAYFLLPVGLLALGISVAFRTILSLVYKYYYNGKCIVPSPTDCTFAVEKHANTLTINTIMYFKGQTDISKVRVLWLNKGINYQAPDGHQPYRKLMWRITRKYGYFAWEDVSDNFDICENVRFCPGTDQLDKVYSSDEVQQAMEKRADDVFSSDRPQWEVLFIPKVRRQKNGEIHYAMITRISHVYMDGVSVVQLLQKLLDSEGKFSIDPVNLPMKKPTFLELLVHYTQVLFLGPYTVYTMSRTQNNHVFQQMEQNVGPKFFGISKLEISVESVKQIRKTFECSTTAIFCSLISGAIRKAAERKDIPVPQEVDIGYTVAVVPYPNSDPQNRFTAVSLPSPLAIIDPVKRLKKLNSTIKQVQLYEVTALYLTTQFIGFCPAFINEKIMTSVRSSFLTTNLPGFTEQVFINGDSLEALHGSPPIKNGIGFGVGTSSYMGKFDVFWMVEKTPIITDRNDLNALIADFDKEFSVLEHLSSTNGNNN